MRQLIGRMPPSSDYMSWIQVYRQDFLAPLLQYLDPKDVKVIFDLGACVGYTVRWFNTHFPDAQIYAVESNPGSFEILKYNGAVKNVHAANLAVWDKNAKLKLDQNYRDGKDWASRCVEHHDGNVTGKPFWQIFAQTGHKHIDIMKIDIEGAEEQLFKDPFFLDITRVLCIEPHNDLWCGASDTITEALKNHGFKTFRKDEIIFGFKD